MTGVAARFSPPVQSYQQKRTAAPGGRAAPHRIAAAASLLMGGTPDAALETHARVSSLKRWRNVAVGFSLAFGLLAGWCVYRRCRLPGGNPFKNSFYTHKNVFWWTLGAFAAGTVSVSAGAFALNRQLKKGRYLDLEDPKVQERVQRRVRRESFTDFREWVFPKRMVAYGAEVPVDGDRMVQYDLFDIPAGVSQAETYCALRDLWKCSEDGADIHGRAIDAAHTQHAAGTRLLEREHQQRATMIHHRQADAAYAGDRARRDVETGAWLADRGHHSRSTAGKVLGYGGGALIAGDGLARGIEASIESHRAAGEAREEHAEYRRLRRPHDALRKLRLETAVAEYGQFCAWVNREAERLLS